MTVSAREFEYEETAAQPVADLAPRLRPRQRPWTEEEKLAAKRARVEAGYVFSNGRWEKWITRPRVVGGRVVPGRFEYWVPEPRWVWV